MTIEEKPKCPGSRRSWYNGVALCHLNDKICLLETDDTCEDYEDYLKELKEEEDGQKLS